MTTKLKHLKLDDGLISEASRLGNHLTGSEAVNAALKEYVQRRRQLCITELFGEVEYKSDYDYKRERQRRHD